MKILIEHGTVKTQPPGTPKDQAVPPESLNKIKHFHVTSAVRVDFLGDDFRLIMFMDSDDAADFLKDMTQTVAKGDAAEASKKDPPIGA